MCNENNGTERITLRRRQWVYYRTVRRSTNIIFIVFSPPPFSEGSSTDRTGSDVIDPKSLRVKDNRSSTFHPLARRRRSLYDNNVTHHTYYIIMCT